MEDTKTRSRSKMDPLDLFGRKSRITDRYKPNSCVLVRCENVRFGYYKEAVYVRKLEKGFHLVRIVMNQVETKVRFSFSFFVFLLPFFFILKGK